MKHLKLYEEYTSNPDHPGFFKTREETKNWLDKMGIKNYTIDDDLVVDTDGDVNLHNKNLKYIPVQFGEVDGDFSCSRNQLTSLTGSPYCIIGGGSFYCSNNQLTSLTSAPSFVSGGFYCSYNQLTSLTGGPSEVDGSFDCSYNQLTSLTGAPDEVTNGSFDCSNNHLTSLTGCPSYVEFSFDNFNNYLTIDEPYIIDKQNPGYKETSLTKVTQNFLDKLETSELDTTSQLRILDSLKEYKPQVYAELVKLVDLDNWIYRLTNSEKHIGIMNL